MFRRLVVATVLAVLAGCRGGGGDDVSRVSASTSAPVTTTSATTTTTFATTTTTVSPTSTTSPFARPQWLGTRLLPLRPDERGEAQPTPAELVDRQFETVDLLPRPSGAAYEWSIGPVPDDVVTRSTWESACPVTLDELSYLTMSHWGFDGEHHTGEMIVNTRWADAIVAVFGRLHEIRFPIEQMRVVSRADVDAHPTGDSNDTTGFVCRPAVGSGKWSNHAYGLAVDINPFHNPYEKGDLVLPELASAYLDRERSARGMILAADEVVEAFADIGWGWGGNWSSLVDYMHFSADGR